MRVYGAEICIDCRNYKAIQKQRGFEADYIDITENVTNFKEFLSMRDQEDLFSEVRENHTIGIPLFVREDGVKTFDIDEAFSWIGQPPVKEEEIVEKYIEAECKQEECTVAEDEEVLQISKRLLTQNKEA